MNHKKETGPARPAAIGQKSQLNHSTGQIELSRAALHAIYCAKKFWWKFIPLRGKVPFHPNWPSIASNSVDQIRRWAKEFPGCNFGLVTGSASGIIALDIDVKGASLVDQLSTLEEKFGPLPPTVIVNTGSGGQHHLFKAPTGIIVRNKVGFLPGMDQRGEGGQTVFAGSIHPVTGVEHTFEYGHSPNDVEIAEAPQWLLQISSENRNRRSPEEWTKLVGGKIEMGSRNAALASMAGKVFRAFDPKDAALAVGLLEAWNHTFCAPPIDRAEFERTVNSILRLELARREARHVG